MLPTIFLQVPTPHASNPKAWCTHSIARCRVRPPAPVPAPAPALFTRLKKVAGPVGGPSSGGTMMRRFPPGRMLLMPSSKPAGAGQGGDVFGQS